MSYGAYGAVPREDPRNHPLFRKEIRFSTRRIHPDESTCSSMQGNPLAWVTGILGACGVVGIAAWYVLTRGLLPWGTGTVIDVTGANDTTIVTMTPTSSPVLLVTPTVAPTPAPVFITEISPTAAPTSPATSPFSPTASPFSPTASPLSPTASPLSPTASPVSPTASPTLSTGSFPTIAPIALTVPTAAPVVLTSPTTDLDEDTYDASTKPHIIYILADDLGWNSIGYENYDLDFATPTLTAMAQSGIILDSFYAQEVCTPARAALLTGRYPLTVGMQYSMVQTAIPWGLDLKETTIAEVLHANGYETHMLGKWHLGHYSPRFLPTARGFDSYLGFLNGESYYWSKRNPDHSVFHDLLYSTTECYVPYTDDDMHDYSTFFYRDKALELIEDYAASSSSDASSDTYAPLYLFLSFQAVHDPFVDISLHLNGMPIEYVDSEIYEQIESSVSGRKRRQYAMALSVLDSAVADIVSALDEQGLLENSVIIFSSDNGGCYGAGGKNGPLRGTKGSMFEGGTKVDAFLWSPKFPSSVQGTVYPNLFHISDMFPTILALTDVSFSPSSGYELDGVNHLPALLGETSEVPRDYMLYNYYYKVDHYCFDTWINGSFAIRNSQYKLMHTFDSSTYAVWYEPDEMNTDDDAITTETRCSSSTNNDGTFTYWLFDLINDPFETTNLYDSTADEHVAAKEELYNKLDDYSANAYEMTFDFSANRMSFEVWRDHDNWMVPYTKTSDLEAAKGTYPEDCYVADDDTSRRRLWSRSTMIKYGIQPNATESVTTASDASRRMLRSTPTSSTNIRPVEVNDVTMMERTRRRKSASSMIEVQRVISTIIEKHTRRRLMPPPKPSITSSPHVLPSPGMLSTKKRVRIQDSA